jgi:acylphosphatase
MGAKARCKSGVNVQKCLHRSEMHYDGQREVNVISRKCFVGGRVQGVFYRATVAQRAREVGIRGYAKNLPDGRVEVLAVGEAEVVQAFIDWLWIGSSASKVTSVDTSDIALQPHEHPKSFTTG